MSIQELFLNKLYRDILSQILSYLDEKSLCKLSMTSKDLNTFISPYWPKIATQNFQNSTFTLDTIASFQWNEEYHWNIKNQIVSQNEKWLVTLNSENSMSVYERAQNGNNTSSPSLQYKYGLDLLKELHLEAGFNAPDDLNYYRNESRFEIHCANVPGSEKSKDLCVILISSFYIHKSTSLFNFSAAHVFNLAKKECVRSIPLLSQRPLYAELDDEKVSFIFADYSKKVFDPANSISNQKFLIYSEWNYNSINAFWDKDTNTITSEDSLTTVFSSENVNSILAETKNFSKNWQIPEKCLSKPINILEEKIVIDDFTLKIFGNRLVLVKKAPGIVGIVENFRNGKERKSENTHSQQPEKKQEQVLYFNFSMNEDDSIVTITFSNRHSWSNCNVGIWPIDGFNFLLDITCRYTEANFQNSLQIAKIPNGCVDPKDVRVNTILQNWPEVVVSNVLVSKNNANSFSLFNQFQTKEARDFENLNPLSDLLFLVYQYPKQNKKTDIMMICLMQIDFTCRNKFTNRSMLNSNVNTWEHSESLALIKQFEQVKMGKISGNKKKKEEEEK